MSEQNSAVDSSVHYNIPELQSKPGRSKPHPHAPSLQPNGQHCPPQPSRQELSTEESEEEDEEDDTEEDEPTTSRWQGIEAIFEAYQEYAEGKMCVQQIGFLSVRVALQILKLWFVGVCDARGFLNVRGGPEESYRSFSLSLCLTLEQSIERQVLHSQCRRLEVHHYNLSLTAEQLSHSMGVRNTPMLTSFRLHFYLILRCIFNGQRRE